MIVFKMFSSFLLCAYGLYILLGFFLIAHELLLSLIIFMSAPLTGPKQIPDEYQTYVAPVSDQLKEIPGLFKDLAEISIWWIILPWKIIWVLATKKDYNDVFI